MKNITFITGFPGFITKRLVERLTLSDREFRLLVEPKFADVARREVEAIALATNAMPTRFEIIEGDITKPTLGLSDLDYDSLTECITEIFHLAAVYDLAVGERLAKSVNVDGTRHVNDFARRCSSLRRYNYISTCYVAGCRRGTIFETELEHTAGFRNFYEATKYEAECSVENLKSEVPTTIMRPAVVVGDSRTGETSKYDGIYYLIKYLMKSPALLRLVNVGNREVTLNLVPVDFVTESIVALADDRNADGATLAIADPEPLSTHQLFDVIANVLTRKTSLLTPPVKLVEIALKSPISPPLTGLPHAGVPYFFLSQSYDTSIASAFLEKAGVKCPRFSAYADRLIDFLKKHPNL